MSTTGAQPPSNPPPHPVAPGAEPRPRPAFPAGPSLRLTEPPPEDCDTLARLFLDDASALPSPPTTPAFPSHRLDKPPHAPAPVLSPSPLDSPRNSTPAATPADTTVIEGVVLGHLPVFRAAWLTSYARRRADALARPVAMLQCRPGHTSLELTQAHARPETQPTLEAAIEAAAPHAPAWLVRVAETEEPELATLSGLTHLTILTAPDDAATVAAYRVIKTFAARPLAPALRVVIVAPEATPNDQPPPAAQRAAARLRAAADAFLDIELEIDHIPARVLPLAGATLYAEPHSTTPADALDLITRRPASTPHTPPATPAPQDLQPPAILPTEPIQPTPDDAPRTNECAHAQPQPDDEFTWTAQLTDLTPLGLRCPYAESVELATDDHGRLHAIADIIPDAEDAPGADARPPDLAPGDAAAALLNAAAWAEAHRHFLALKDPRLAAAPAPALHLITPSAAAARPLLDTHLTLHLAVRARKSRPGRDTRDGLLLAPLNTPRD